MERSIEEKQRRRDYRERLRQSTPRPKLFPFSRLVVSAALSGTQSGISTLRHRLNPSLPAVHMGTGMALFIMGGIVVYMIFYILEWSWNYVVVSPRMVHYEDQAKLKQQAHEIAALTEKLKTPDSVKKQKETSITFANLVKEGKDIEEQIITNQKPHELTAITQQLNDWIERTEAALIESNLHADASIFVRSGERPSTEQTRDAVPDYVRNQPWKHNALARLSLYLKKLQEIVERRNL